MKFMGKQNLTPQESLELISDVIRVAKQRQEERGGIYIYWGLIIFVVGLGHYILQEMEAYDRIYLPYLFIPLAAALSYLIFPYYQKGKGLGDNKIGSIIGGVWLFAGINMMVVGFFLSQTLGRGTVPVILILEGIALGISGIAVDSRTLIYAGILANLAGVSGFWIENAYHPLLMAGIAILSLVLPGIILNHAYRRRKYL